jgi:ankyrin repeat protein
MPVRSLPPSPNLKHLKSQAKDLLQSQRARHDEAAQRLREFHPRFARAQDAEIFAAKLLLSDAQLAIAREYGFASWARLKHHIENPALTARLRLPHHERIDDARFRSAVDLIDQGDADRLREHLRSHPGLVHERMVFEGGNYFHHPTLLEFIAENPIRRGTLPENIVEVAKVILDAGADQASRNETLALVATGSVPRERNVQTALIELLCRNSADPNPAATAAALHHELEAVNALLGCGASITLPIAAALGKFDEARRLLLTASPDDRHLALTVAADLGRANIVRLLLEAGEDPNRYNPIGGHSHTTPLHQAAGAGHEDVVRVLVESGARLDIKDILSQGTPADWARHAGNTAIEQHLRERAAANKKSLP